MKKKSGTKKSKLKAKSQWVNKEITEEIRKYSEINENKNTSSPNLWVTSKAIPKEKIIAVQAYLKKQEKYQVNNLNYHIKD